MDTKSNGSNSSEPIWAIIDSGSRRLMGMVPYGGVSPGDTVQIKEAVELDTSVTRLPGPSGQPVSILSPIMIPIDMEEDPVDIVVLVHNIRYFEYMKDRGRRYMMMREQLLSQLTQLRAKRAGIELASALPRSPINKGGGFLG